MFRLFTAFFIRLMAGSYILSLGLCAVFGYYVEKRLGDWADAVAFYMSSNKILHMKGLYEFGLWYNASSRIAITEIVQIVVTLGTFLILIYTSKFLYLYARRNDKVSAAQ